jgi:type IV pilus assembly protein PilX
MHSALPGIRHQRGVALFISLVLLLILTILGVSAVQTTSLEERMARNSNDWLLAFQAAESALRDAEDFIETVTATAPFTTAGTNGLWEVSGVGEVDRWEVEGNWTGGGSVEAPTDVRAVPTQPAPRYMIEHMATLIRDENAYQVGDPYLGGTADRVEIFRVTALGTGGSPNAQVMLQSTYGRVLD